LIGEDADLVLDSRLLRLLCALPPEVLPRVAAPGLTSPQQATVATWLAALPARLPGWQRLSITDVRTLFLQRTGVLRCERSTWQLELARDASDWLLMQWPWQHLRVTLSGVVTADDNICIRAILQRWTSSATLAGYTLIVDEADTQLHLLPTPHY
jgi:hypothetical protein